MSTTYTATYVFNTEAQSPAEAVDIARQDMRLISREQLFRVENKRTGNIITNFQESPAMRNGPYSEDDFSGSVFTRDSLMSQENEDGEIVEGPLPFQFGDGVALYKVTATKRYTTETMRYQAEAQAARVLQMDLLRNWDSYIFTVAQEIPASTVTFKVSGETGMVNVVD